MKLLLAAIAALTVQGCSNAGATDSATEEHKCEVKYELKKFPVKPGVAPGCPAGQPYILYQGYFADKDGSNAWCNKQAQVCDEVK